MTERSGKGEAGKQATRQDRLKLALRENLKRRKAQERERARERGKLADAPSSSHDASPDGWVGKRGD
jgi:hypothetical protein